VANIAGSGKRKQNNSIYFAAFFLNKSKADSKKHQFE